ncbi:MAG: thioredoxin [Smithellaceae bacterium]|nr:thioredoxin [Smithellaceae bacterium]
MEKSLILHASDSDFEATVEKADQPTLVDFWAPWCGPCRAIAPLLEEIAARYTDRVKVVKVNVDENPQTSLIYGIKSIPTLLLFRGGKIVDRQIGLTSKEGLAALIEKNLN